MVQNFNGAFFILAELHKGQAFQKAEVRIRASPEYRDTKFHSTGVNVNRIQGSMIINTGDFLNKTGSGLNLYSMNTIVN